ncbi:MAG: hypothetical protein JW745_00505 [Sedimentisphaerales bacterium]|nr:hypothetical protein [Sedimentisphaerales bacterium]MBN2843339.1 hypothetical protein [Sedimentisphaerales bacterium]
MILCNDVDLFKWEPKLFSTSGLAERYICRGSGGVISGTEFNASDNIFLLSGVEPGGVLYVWNTLAGVSLCCEIVSIGLGGNLVISIVRADDSCGAVPVGSFTNLEYAVVSYTPLIEEVSYSLLAKYGLIGRESEISNIRQLRQSCVFAVLSACYAGAAMADEQSELYWSKSHYYRKLFDEARCGFEVLLDVNGDDQPDESIAGNSIIMERM